MNNRYPNAWNFSNSDKNLVSKNGRYKIEYGEMYEIAMGAPLGAECFLLDTETKHKIKICDWAGGPAIWNNNKNCVVFPIWTKNRAQQIRVIDIDLNKIFTYSQIFRVLELAEFKGETIYGIDSPIHKSKELSFDLMKHKVESEVPLYRELKPMTETHIYGSLYKKPSLWETVQNWFLKK